MNTKISMLVLGLIVGLGIGFAATTYSGAPISSPYGTISRCSGLKGIEEHVCHTAAVLYDMEDKIDDTNKKLDRVNQKLDNLYYKSP